MLSIERLKTISGCAKITPGAARASSSPGVPSPVVSQERSLPKELWVHALEYASLDEAFAAFDVSKAFRSASRFALNKGRWAPVVKVVLAIKSFPWRRHGFAKQKPVDDVKAQFCAAWHAREPLLLVAILDEVGLGNFCVRDMERILGALLKTAEPVISDDALARIVATLEHVEAMVPLKAQFTGNIFEEWYLRVQGPSPFLASNDWVPPLFHAAERCVSGHHAGTVLCGVLFHILGYDDAAEFETETFARKMTAGWSDEHKRDELVAVFRGVQRDRAEELQEELGAIEREAWSSDPTGWPG